MALERHFSRDQFFMDVNSIQAGFDFSKVIDAEVAKCDVMLVVIGKGWIDARDAAGRRRLDGASDFVRLEVECALLRDIRVVPVLVDGASLSKAEDLPEGMRGLVRRQGWPLSHARFGAESEGLVGEISKFVSADTATGTRTDWTAEAAKFFFYLLGGLCLIAAVTYVGFQLDTSRLGREPTPDYVGFDMALSISMWLFLVVALLIACHKLTYPALLALWISSVASAALVASLTADTGSNLYKPTILAPLAVITVIYIFISGPALILWGRRKRG